MAWLPFIRDYKPFYIQAANDVSATDTREWGLIAKVNPYPALPSPKDPYKNDWHDEHGEEEYTEEMYYKPLEFSVSFYVKCIDTTNAAAINTLRGQIDDFFDKIKEGEFSVYDSYTGLGRQKVRYAGYKEDEFLKTSDGARSIFTVSFKCNDPITRMVLTNGKIVSE